MQRNIREVVRGIKRETPDGAFLTLDAGLSASLNLRCRIRGTILNLPPEKWLHKFKICLLPLSSSQPNFSWGISLFSYPPFLSSLALFQPHWAALTSSTWAHANTLSLAKRHFCVFGQPHFSSCRLPNSYLGCGKVTSHSAYQKKKKKKLIMLP